MIKKNCLFCGKIMIVRLNKMKYHQECYFKSLNGKGNPFYGRKHTIETKQKMLCRKITWGDKISKAKKGVKYSEERKKEISKRMKGKGNPFFGRKHTIKTKEKISLANKGKLLGDLNPSKRQEVIRKIKEKMIGRKITWNDKISTTRIKKFESGELIPPNLGKPMNSEQKLKISKIRIEKGLAKLEKNPMWKGGLSYEPYPLTWTNELREQIRVLYQNKCFKCGNYEISKDKRTNNIRKIPIHHINYIKNDVRSTNLVPLCTKCHSKVNQNRDYWLHFFCNKLNISSDELTNNKKS